jgi:glycosyltransferase involved in cell wall biosynthesis
VSTYPPREDGLATFTRDLLDGVRAAGGCVERQIAAITAPRARHDYPPEVVWRIEQDDPLSYAVAGKALTRAGVDVVSLQFEFSLFGKWEDEETRVALEDHTPWLLDALDRPVVTTLHTVIPHPSQQVKAVVQRLYDRSASLVVMANIAVKFLVEDYGLDPERIAVIPHGVPDLPSSTPAQVKRELGLEGHTLLCTFGLIRRSKGIEYMVRALPAIVERHPEALYLVLGDTHPAVRESEGYAYREELRALAEQLGVAEHVWFDGKYLAHHSLLDYLLASDIYVTPYLDRLQITSGTLSYALGFGLATISTPYLHATEALAEGRGLLAEFANPDSLARCVNLYLDDPDFTRKTRERVLAYGSQMTWQRLGGRYAELFERVAEGEALASLPG